ALAGATNPLLRLEPIDSIRRIAEDRIGDPGRTTFGDPVVPTLFDPETSVVPYTLGDLVMYAIRGGSVDIANPFTGQRYGRIGDRNTSVQDFAFRAYGELFGDSQPGTLAAGDFDDSYAYFRITSEDGSLSNHVLSGLQTFHAI